MRTAIYAVSQNNVWIFRISLDLRVDLMWWSGRTVGTEGTKGREEDINKGNKAVMILLHPSIPLSWAVKVQAGFKGRQSMEQWGFKEWEAYVKHLLEGELREEQVRNLGYGNRRTAEDWVQWGNEEVRGNVVIASKTIWRWCLSESMGPQQLACLERPVEAGQELADLRNPQMARRVNDMAELLCEQLSGRSLLSSEVDALLDEVAPELAGAWYTAAQLAYLRGQLLLGAGLAAPSPHERRGCRARRGKSRALRCQRCGSEAQGRTACAACGLAACAYCEACLALGRSRACSLLLRTAALPAVHGAAGGSTAEVAGRWGLSAAQGEAACAALGFLAEQPKGSASRSRRLWERRQEEESGGAARFLLWAVTGAGKTEMIFPLLDSVLAASGRVLVATPRRDVVLELAPRLAKAFQGMSLVALYGGSKERWQSAGITLATTHQLLRFYHKFDLVVIDELDAFPYHNDPMLAFAAQQACKPEGKFIYLSATPPRALQKEVARGILQHAKVPVRFHGHPLPVPKRVTLRSIQQCLQQPMLLKSLNEQLRHSLTRGAQIFLFVSRIRHIEPLVQILRKTFAQVRVEGTSSVDPQRAEKVISFRQKEIRLLVTTTILERGVTVPRSDVFIADADSSLFDEASLVQMAGRAGRSSEDPAGIVVFASPQWTLSQKRAVKQIKSMNRIAMRKGYIQSKH